VPNAMDLRLAVCDDTESERLWITRQTEDILRAETCRGQDDFLIGLYMLVLGELIYIAVIYHNTALVGKTHISHVFLKLCQSVILHNNLLGFKSMLSAADTFAYVFFAIHNHDSVPPNLFLIKNQTVSSLP